MNGCNNLRASQDVLTTVQRQWQTRARGHRERTLINHILLRAVLTLRRPSSTMGIHTPKESSRKRFDLEECSTSLRQRP